MDGAHAVNRYVADTIDQRTLPTLRNKEQALANYAASLGILYGFPDYSGWRSQADTTQLIAWRDQAVAAGGASAYYPVAPYGVGYHGKGAAFDIKVVKWPVGRSSDWAYQQLGAYAPRIGLRWGGTFSGRTVDPYHFELAVSIADAQAQFDAWQKEQRAAVASGKPAVVLTPSAPSTQPLLTFTNFQLPTDTNALPKSLTDIQSILKGAGTLGVVLIVGAGLVLAGLLFGPRGG
jgi:hypothetical protein